MWCELRVKQRCVVALWVVGGWWVVGFTHKDRGVHRTRHDMAHQE